MDDPEIYLGTAERWSRPAADSRRIIRGYGNWKSYSYDEKYPPTSHESSRSGACQSTPDAKAQESGNLE